MTDMDEIRAKVRNLRSAAYASGKGLDVSVDDKEAALLQRVEALREERDNLVRSRIDRAACCAKVEEDRDAALAAQKRAEEERDEARADAALNRAKYEGAVSAIPVVVAKETERIKARALAAESALAALRAAPPAEPWTDCNDRKCGRFSVCRGLTRAAPPPARAVEALREIARVGRCIACVGPSPCRGSHKKRDDWCWVCIATEALEEIDAPPAPPAALRPGSSTETP